MKTLLLLAVSLCLGGCFTPIPEVSEGRVSAPVSGSLPDGGYGQGPANGQWIDATACNGSELTGCFYSDFGFGPPSAMGTIPLACRPVVGTYKATCGEPSGLIVPAGCPRTADGGYVCAVSDGTYACSVTVASSGVVSFVGTTGPSMRVCPRLQ